MSGVRAREKTASKCECASVLRPLPLVIGAFGSVKERKKFFYRTGLKPVMLSLTAAGPRRRSQKPTGVVEADVRKFALILLPTYPARAER
jgi:hypothetical protein